ncbi:hypothetical protein JCM19046_2544 [Bacillus sp. JCM 19046]|nr:hypothetical protein JCM19045_1140 [Bacillus sp. JCM 19045]GAF18003.1 hypothetical protein JCM19046_2544 [Bacillus sp. JCM 19046]
MIYVDADSCPVKEEIISLSRKYKKDMVFVFSYAHNMNLPEDVKTAVVDTDKEAADLYLLQHVKRDDICITQDHALASLLIIKGVSALSPRGHIFTEEEMNGLLQSRYASQKARRAGKKTKGPTKFTKEDRITFYRALENKLAQQEFS